jgi:hypothetical protein
MLPNIGIVALAALIPMIIGFIYYNPKVLGTVWMKVSGMTEEKMKESNMALVFGLSYVLSFLMCFMLGMLVVHQTDVYSLFNGQEGFGVPGSEVTMAIDEVMRLAENNFRTFKHGALHGCLTGIFIALPILMTNGLFEGKSIKYGFVNATYWIITMTLAGGVLCLWG